MKKKIKDLTLEEKDKICHKYQNKHLCGNCPFKRENICIIEELEREVEVDE